MSDQLDAVDARILDLIQHDASLSVAEIAERVGLSSSPCWRRIKRLEDDGVIQRRVTILDREKLGLGFEVYCTVKLSLPTKDNLDTFEQSVQRWPEVVQCATVTGAADYELRIVTRDMHAFDDFLRDKILSLGLVSNIESRIVIRAVKNTTAAPLGLISPSGTVVAFFTERTTILLSMLETSPSDRIFSRRKSSKACMSRVTMRSS